MARELNPGQPTRHRARSRDDRDLVEGYAVAAPSLRSFPGCPLLSEGHSSGPCVTNLQELPNAEHGEFHLVVDGRFGPQVRTAVLDFQGRHHLSADGLVGPKTADTLAAAAAEAAPGGSASAPNRDQQLTPFELCQQEKPGSVSDGHGGCVSDGAIAQGKSLPTCLEQASGSNSRRRPWPR